MKQGKKLFSIHFTEAERATLESERARLGLRSMAEVIRHWIADAPQRGELQQALDDGALLLRPGQIVLGARLTNAKGEPKELPKPRKAFKSRLKGEWKAP